MNPLKNEKIVDVGGEKILLRPTFENCANLEQALGFGLPMLAYNLAQKKLPNMTDLAKVVYFCQAEKKLTLEQVWELVLKDGMAVATQVLEFVAIITAGDRSQPELTDSQKKS